MMPNTNGLSDGRKPFDSASRYSAELRAEIKNEAVYLIVLLVVALTLTLLTVSGKINTLLHCIAPESAAFNKYLLYGFSGMIGGLTFDIKYFYRSVARGYWHQDRKYWRMMLPFVSMVMALIIGAMIEASLIEQKAVSNSAVIAIGFLSGYFADDAASKMADVANVVFGSNTYKKKEPGDGNENRGGGKEGHAPSGTDSP